MSMVIERRLQRSFVTNANTAILLFFVITTVEIAQAADSVLSARTTTTTNIPAFHFRCTGTSRNTHSSSSTHHGIHCNSGRLSHCHRERGRQKVTLFAIDDRGDVLDDDDDDDTAKTIITKQAGQEQLITRKSTRQQYHRFVLPVAEFIGHNKNNKDDTATRTRTSTSIIRLGIEPGPLIGGPSWLPVHVKVVLQQQPVQHINHGDETTTVTTSTTLPSSLPSSFAWDFVPVRARDEETFKEIIQLRSVPGKIRFFASGQRVNVDDLDQWLLLSQSSTSTQANDDDEKNDEQMQEQQEQLYHWANHAQTFCNEYYTNRDLHFIFNNCWTFAFQLCVHLLLINKQQQQQQQQDGK